MTTLTPREQELKGLIDEGKAFLVDEPDFDVEKDGNTNESLNVWLNKREALFMIFKQLGTSGLQDSEKALLDELYQLGDQVLNWLESHRDKVWQSISDTHHYKETVNHYAFPELEQETRTWET